MKKRIDKSPINMKAKALKDIYPAEYNRGTICELWTIALEENVVTRKLYNEAKIHYGAKWNKTRSQISQKLHSI